MSNQERSAAYLAQFQVGAVALAARLEPDQITTPLTEIPLELATLKKALVAAADFLPRYDQRQVESQIKALEFSYDARKAASAPRSKFSFKKASTRTAPPPSSTPPAPPAPVAVATPTRVPRSPNDISIIQVSNQVVNLPSLPMSANSSGFGLDLEDLSHCIIDLRPSSTDSETSLTALHGKNLKNCVLLAPLVRGSVMLSGCDGCLLVLGGWQFRMHSSSHTEIFLYTTSDSSTPIIEGCRDLSFGPYVLEHGQKASTEDFLPQPLDFSHPNPSYPSPNWFSTPTSRIEETRKALSLLNCGVRLVGMKLDATLDRLLSAAK